MVPKWTSKYVAHRDHIRDLRSDQQGDNIVLYDSTYTISYDLSFYVISYKMFQVRTFTFRCLYDSTYTISYNLSFYVISYNIVLYDSTYTISYIFSFYVISYKMFQVRTFTFRCL